VTSAAVHIRPTRLDDAVEMAALRRHPAVARNIYAFPSQREDQVRAFMERSSPDDHVFVAELDGRLVGMAGLHVRGGKERHSAHVGLGVHVDFQGRGIGRALMVKLLDLADRWLGLVRVDLTTVDDNLRAIALYKSLGFELEATQRKASFVEGAFHDVLLMSRLRGG
jgi:L-phenylalanine/L-methionine N-acetyltransferase